MAAHCPNEKTKILISAIKAQDLLSSKPHLTAFQPSISAPLPPRLSCSLLNTRCVPPPQGLCTCCAHLLTHLFLPFSSTEPQLTLQFSVLRLVLFQTPDLPNHVNPPAPLQALKLPHTCQSQRDISEGDFINAHLLHWAMSSLWEGITISPVPGTE